MAAIGWLLWGEVAHPDNDSGDLTGSRRGCDRFLERIDISASKSI
ncbi:hypothetical protein [Coleofasciculus sp.]